MEIMEFGNPEDRCLILIHGFESPWQIWKPYVEAYRDQFYILVPILPGHNPGRKERFDSFDECARELEEFCRSRSILRIHTVYGMSMGGLVAAKLWSRENLKMDRLIFSSSPVCAWNPTFTKLMQRQYLRLTHRAQRGDKKVLQQAVGTMIREEQMEVFLDMLYQVTDENITRYLQQTGAYQLPKNLNAEGMEICYICGGTLLELPFRCCARKIEKWYPGVQILCRSGRGHCEDALIHPRRWLPQLDQLIL